MALTLDSNLQTQLDGIERRPIAQIVTTSFASSIPFNGNHFGISQSNAFYADMKLLSDGSLGCAFSGGDREIKWMLTDISRTQWSNPSSILLSFPTHISTDPPSGISFCEKPDGNIGVAYRYTIWATSRYCIRVCTISKAGVLIHQSTLIVQESVNADVLYEPYLIYNSNASAYQVFYSLYDSATGSHRIYMKSSSDFTTWGSAVDITPANLGTTKKYADVHAFVLSDGDIALSFEYTNVTEASSGFETKNIYYMISTDDGSTWGNATAVTAYTGTGKAARHPSIAEKSTGGIYCSFHDRETFVTFDSSAAGLISDCGTAVYAHDVHVYNGRLYVTTAYASMGTKKVCGFYVVDPTDMSIIAQYTSTTSPGYNDLFANQHSFWWTTWSDGKYMIRKVNSTGGCDDSRPLGEQQIINSGCIVVVANDGISESVTEYVFGNGCDLPTWGLEENVSIPNSNHWVANPIITHAWIDAARDRMYVWLASRYLYDYMACYGYIDLTESPDPGTGYYTWTELYRKTDTELSNAYGLAGCNYAGCQNFSWGRYCKEDDVIVMVQGDGTSWDDNSCILVIDAQTGVIQFCKSHRTDSNVPYNGLRTAYVYDNKIYGCFTYTTLHDQEERRGLWIYDMVTESSQTVRPGYKTVDQYYFNDYCFNDIGNGYIWIATYDGALRYHIGNQYFEPFTPNEIPGMDMGTGGPSSYYIHYDPVGEDVYIGDPASYTKPWWGVIRFNVNGDYRKGQYQLGTKIGTDLGLTNQQDLTVGYYEMDIVTTVDGDDVLWAIWDHIDNVDNDRDLYWDHDKSESDVSDDLTDVIELSWDIEMPSELRFYLANGHKYDQQNSLSTLSYLFLRGRKIIPKLGENVGGTPYLVQQGVYIVEETTMQYSKGEHPVLEVTARDISALWEDHTIVLTDYYDGVTPKYTVEELLGDWTVLESAEFSIPTFATSHTIWHQWQDESLYDILKSILDHFEYVFYFDNNGVFTPKRLEFTKATDHTYSDQLQIRNYSPDSSFSSFVNQVRVIGETHDFMEIVYDPEQVGTVNGTCGWWDETVYHTVYYNEERTRKCRNPYLVVNVSTADFEFFIFKGGGSERISYEDPEELYVIVEVVGPNLIPVVVGLTIGLLVLGGWAIWCDGGFVIGGYCGVAIMALCVDLNLLCYALLAVATYDFEIWAMPVGKQKQTIQYLARDDSAMSVINMQPVVEEIEDPLCYEVAECQRVAEYELNVMKYQRERIKLSKLGHLQDEIHDMLVVNHPYSGQPMSILVANLVRTLVIKGELTDSIEGWRIT